MPSVVVTATDRAPVRLDFETTEPARAHDFICSTYGETAVRFTGASESFHLCHRAMYSGRLSLAVAHHNTPVEHVVRPTGRLLVLRVLAGRLERDSGGESLLAGEGDILLAARPDEPHAIRWDSIRVQVTDIDLAAVAAVAGSAAGEPPHRIASWLSGLAPVSAVQTRHWRNTVDYVVASVLRDDDALCSPLVVGSSVRLLAAATLAAFPTRLAAAPSRWADASPAMLRRAIALMEERARTDLTVAAVAAGVRVSPATLRLAFRRHLGTSPAAHLRRIRLEWAHESLLYADPEARPTVTAVARRCGFVDLVRFAAAYREAYGRSPGQTLGG